MFKNQDEKLQLIQPGMIIIGVDVAKRSHWMQPMHYNGILIGKAFNIKNTREGFESLAAKIARIKQETGCQRVLVGMENIKAALNDKDFKKALVNNPKEALAQIGVQFPEEVDVKVVESPKSASKVVYLVLPTSPDKLTDQSGISPHDCCGPSLPLVVCLYCPFH